MDYKEKLKRKVASPPEEQVEEVSPYAARIEALAQDVEAGRVVFQSVAVTALQLLERAMRRDRQAVEAALSLGQREKLQDMLETLETTAKALREALSEQGAQMLSLCEEPKTGDSEERSWWFALTEAIEALEDGAQQMAPLAAGQPEGSAARELGELTEHLMRQHHADLLTEAEQWIS